MNFEESENYLYSLGNEVEAMKLGLANIQKLLAELGDPQDNFRKIQVAGTNGKGSVCAFLDSICREAEIRTGLYTSPHLVSVTERIKIDGGDISEGDFARIATRVREASEALASSGELETVPTYFEQVTAIGLSAFAEAYVELAILETGLGGRFDATTAAGAELAVITRIDLDHQEYLGETIEKIAAEKAAIINKDTTAVIGEQVDAAMRVILDRCEVVGATRITSAEIIAENVGDGMIRFARRGTESDSLSIASVRLGLAGAHQIENARTAVAAALELRKAFTISDPNIADGLAKAQHPGRLERIGRFLLDGAHNPSGAKALRRYLDENVPGAVTMIFGAMKDKDVAEMARILWPRADRLFLTQVSNPRAMDAEDLYRFLPDEMSETNIVVTPDVKTAIGTAESSSSGTVVVTGSLYLVGEVLSLLNN